MGFNKISLLKFYWKEAQLVLLMDHIKTDSNTLSDCLTELWFKISGFDTFPLKHLAYVLNNWPLSKPYYYPFFNKDSILNNGDIFSGKLLLTIHIKFLISYKNTDKTDEVYIRYDVPKALLFNPRLTTIKYKGFIKFINKNFNKHEIDISKAYYTKISVFLPI